MWLDTELRNAQKLSYLFLPHSANQTLHGKTHGCAADGACTDTYTGLGWPFTLHVSQDYVPGQPGHSWDTSLPCYCKVSDKNKHIININKLINNFFFIFNSFFFQLALIEQWPISASISQSQLSST